MGLTRQTKYIIFHIKPQSVQLMYETMSSEKVFKHELANFQSLFCPLNSFYGSAFISVPTKFICYCCQGNLELIL